MGEMSQTTTTAAHEHAHRSRVVRNRTILGSFPLFYKLSQSLSSLNTKSEVSNSCSAFVKTNVENSSSSDSTTFIEVSSSVQQLWRPFKNFFFHLMIFGTL